MKDGNGATRRKTLLAGAAGHFVEWYDFGLYGVLATTIAAEFFPKSDPAAGLLSTFVIFAVGFFFRPLGGIALGRLSDRIGRRPTLILSVTLMSTFTVAMGLIPGYAQIGIVAPILLVLCRTGQGFSAGGEQTGAIIFLIEHASYGRRGRYASISPIVTSLAAGSGALVAVLTQSMTTPEQLASWGWRVPFVAALPLALISLYLRLRVDESPVFAALRADGLIEAAPIKQALAVAKKPMVVMAAWAMATNVAYYLMIAFLFPYLNRTANFSSIQSLTVLLIGLLVLAVSSLVAGYSIDRVGRKRVAVVSALGLAVWAIPAFVFLQHSSLLGAILVVVVFEIFIAGFNTTCSLLFVELFPAAVRTSASALSYQLSTALFGGTAPYVATWLLGRGHLLGPAYYLAGVCAIACVVAAIGIGNHVGVNPQHDVLRAPTEDPQGASA